VSVEQLRSRLSAPEHLACQTGQLTPDQSDPRGCGIVKAHGFLGVETTTFQSQRTPEGCRLEIKAAADPYPAQPYALHMDRVIL
jgi:hypothetical protein